MWPAAKNGAGLKCFWHRSFFIIFPLILNLKKNQKKIPEFLFSKNFNNFFLFFLQHEIQKEIIFD